MIRAPVKPEMLTWARERAGMEPAALARRFPKLSAWENGGSQPTLKQLEQFANAVHVPVGFLFLPEPPLEQVPLPDFRLGGERRERPSPDLLDTIYTCQRRHEWYRDFARIAGEPRRAFVGSLSLQTPIALAAGAIRTALGFDVDARRDCPTWTDALRTFIAQAESIGVLVMCSGIVHNNTHRVLDPAEFRGFAIADSLAPLVFINGADSKAAQMFTLAHELGHLWLGQSALTDAGADTRPTDDVEGWCNKVAAELLVPESILRAEYDPRADLPASVSRFARRFKVSTLVVIRRLLDIGAINYPRFRAFYEAELERLNAMDRGSGGNFYLSQAARVSKRFASALIESTLEGRTLYRDAMQMLGVGKLETFTEFGRRLHFPI